MKKIIATTLCLFIIASCVSRKTKAKYFDYKSLKDSYAKVTDSLYASITEVSNGDYREFIEELKITDTAKFNAYNIESFRWKNEVAYGEPMVKYYFNHPAYKDYPLANVSYDGAVAYCKWLTQNYHKNPKRQYKKVVFRLPTEEEWKVAARGGRGNVYFPWAGPFMRNSKGSYQANFKTIDEAYARDTSINGKKIIISSPIEDDNEGHMRLSDNGIVTTPVKSYFPNNYGIYNMAGNVSEMLSEKGKTKGGNWNSYGYYLRIDAPDEFEGKMLQPSPLVGFRVFIEVLEE